MVTGTHSCRQRGGWSKFIKNFGIGILLKLGRPHSEQTGERFATNLLPHSKYEAGLGVTPAFLEWMPLTTRPPFHFWGARGKRQIRPRPPCRSHSSSPCHLSGGRIPMMIGDEAQRTYFPEM